MNENITASIPLAWDYANAFVMHLTVESEHIDGLSHVNNAVYVKWCELVGWHHSTELGLSLNDYQTLDRAMAIRRSEFEYLQAAHLGDQLSAATWLTNTDNRLALERHFQIIRVRDGATLLRARWDLICIAMSSGRPKRMPVEFKSIYGAAVRRFQELS